MKTQAIVLTVTTVVLLVVLNTAVSEKAGHGDDGDYKTELHRLKRVPNKGWERRTTTSAGFRGAPYPDSAVTEDAVDYWDTYASYGQSDETIVEAPVDFKHRKKYTTTKHKKNSSSDKPSVSPMWSLMLSSTSSSEIDDDDDDQVPGGHEGPHCFWYCKGKPSVCVWVCSKHIKGIDVEEIMRIAITKFENGYELVDDADKDGNGLLSVNEIADFVEHAFVPALYDLDRDGFLAAHEVAAAGRK